MLPNLSQLEQKWENKKAQVDRIYRGKRLNNDPNTVKLIFKTEKIGQVKTFLQFGPKIVRNKILGHSNNICNS